MSAKTLCDEPTLLLQLDRQPSAGTIHLRREIVEYAVRQARRTAKKTTAATTAIPQSLPTELTVAIRLPPRPRMPSRPVDVAGGWPVFPLVATLLVLLVTAALLGAVGQQAAVRRASPPPVVAPSTATATATSAKQWTEE